MKFPHGRSLTRDTLFILGLNLLSNTVARRIFVACKIRFWLTSHFLRIVAATGHSPTMRTSFQAWDWLAWSQRPSASMMISSL